MAKVRCWNCNAENDPVVTEGFCDHCGRKLSETDEGIAEAPRRRADPDDEPRPRRRRAEYDRENDGDYDRNRRRRRDERDAQKALNQASWSLFAVAILQFICGTVVLVLVPAGLGVDPDAVLGVAVVVLGLGVAFGGLGVWARYQPLPPAIIGLTLYILVTIADLAMDLERATKGFYVKAIIIVVLAQGIAAANKYNRLRARYEDDYLLED